MRYFLIFSMLVLINPAYAYATDVFETKVNISPLQTTSLLELQPGARPEEVMLPYPYQSCKSACKTAPLNRK